MVPNVAGIGLEEAGRQAGRARLRRGRPGLAHLGARRLRGRRLHRRAACWPRSRPCRAGSRCGTRWARRCTRSGSSHVAANVFTDPEIATVGVAAAAVESGEVPRPWSSCRWPRNARAKMARLPRRFREALRRPATGVVLGGVIVAPRASELILPVSMAVEQRAHRRPAGPDVHGLPVPVRQPGRGRPQADEVRRLQLRGLPQAGGYGAPPQPSRRTLPGGLRRGSMRPGTTATGWPRRRHSCARGAPPSPSRLRVTCVHAAANGAIDPTMTQPDGAIGQAADPARSDPPRRTRLVQSHAATEAAQWAGWPEVGVVGDGQVMLAQSATRMSSA